MEGAIEIKTHIWTTLVEEGDDSEGLVEGGTEGLQEVYSLVSLGGRQHVDHVQVG